MTDGTAFLKGHGTENDFVILPDPDGASIDLTAARGRARSATGAPGIGADGVLRVVRRPRSTPSGRAWPPTREWFMDYRNADGSVAEMCGNGIRVFARYLVDARAGARRRARGSPPAPASSTCTSQDGEVTVDMGARRGPAARPRSRSESAPGRPSTSHGQPARGGLRRRSGRGRRAVERARVRPGAVPRRRERRIRRTPWPRPRRACVCTSVARVRPGRAARAPARLAVAAAAGGAGAVAGRRTGR